MTLAVSGSTVGRGIKRRRHDPRRIGCPSAGRLHSPCRLGSKEGRGITKGLHNSCCLRPLKRAGIKIRLRNPCSLRSPERGGIKRTLHVWGLKSYPPPLSSPHPPPLGGGGVTPLPTSQFWYTQLKVFFSACDFLLISYCSWAK